MYGVRIDGLGGTASSAKKAATKPAPKPAPRPTSTSTHLAKDALIQQVYDAGRSPGVSASWAPKPPPTGITQTPGVSTPVKDPIKQPPVIVQDKEQEDDGGTTVTQPPGTVSNPTTFDVNTLNTLLAQLEAQYGLTREQLLAEQGEVGNLYRFAMNNLNRLNEQASAANVEASLGRGILRSGIHLENQAGIEQDFAGRRAQAEAEKARNLQFIQQEIGSLEAQLALERQRTAQGMGQRGLGHERSMAAAGV